MNVITPSEPSDETPCRCVDDVGDIVERYHDYMSDESRMACVQPECIYFPRSTDEVSWAVRDAARRDVKVVVSGARTGIAGGAAVCERAAVVCLEGLDSKPDLCVDKERDRWTARVSAGMTVAELAAVLRNGSEGVFYPVDPTETSAQLGGTLATNASGARTFYYGPTRSWVDRIRVVLADGRVVDLRRGEVAADGLEFRLVDETGEEGVVILPDAVMPETKHTAGYFIKRDMDAVDLFIGSEGTLGIITEMELRLARRAAENLYLCQYFDGEKHALDFVTALRSDPALSPLAVEYFDPHSIELLRARRQTEGASSGVPDLADNVKAVVYTEFAFEEESDFDEVGERISVLAAECSATSAESWAGFQRKDLEGMKMFRHTLPETVNSIVAQRKASTPGLHKVGTDMAVPFEHFRTMMDVYRSRLDESGYECVIFGHIGDGHVHVNILPRDADELAGAKEMYVEFAKEAVRLGGSVSAEHGIGRLKKSFLRIQYPDTVIEGMRRIKQAFDPGGLLNPGVLFGETVEVSVVTR